MKKFSFLICVLLASFGFAQNYYNLEANNVRAMISDGGVFFENGTISNAAYEVPIGSDNKAIYAMGFWMAGLNSQGGIRSSYNKYIGQNELFAGPVSDNYSSSYYTTTYGQSLWTVTKSEIDSHIANYSNSGYTVPPNISNWPANGYATEGIADDQAPYVDVNANGTYDPVNGDYPFIHGDQAAYVILNDDNGTHGVVGDTAMSVEVHVMFYQYATSDDLNNTTFFNVKVHNRGNETYPNFRFGIYSDFDLGNYDDDYWGCDSARNYMYVYNADNDDESGGGANGYGANPPALGIVSLSRDLQSAMSMISGQDPNTSNEYYNVMQGLNANGSAMVHSSGFDTKFQFSDDVDGPDSELSLANTPGDRRGLMNVEPFALPPGESICMDFAVVYNRDIGVDNQQNALDLDGVVDFINGFYSTDIQPCNTVAVGMADNDKLSFEIYPNPSNGKINIQVVEPLSIEVFSLTGELVYTIQLNVGNNIVSLEQAKGVYLIKLFNDRHFRTERIIIK